MTSVSPAEGTLLSRPGMRSTIAGTVHHVAGRISIVSRLSTLFKEMIMVAMAVVVAVGLILYLLSVPPYYELKLTRAVERGAGVSSENHQVEGEVKMGLEYASIWRVKHWGTNFLSVRIHFPF
jgi:hypothetical protein